MATLLESLMSLATPAVGGLAQRLGESDGAVSRGLQASLASILGGLVTKSDDVGVVRRVFDLITSPNNDTSVATDPDELVRGMPSSASSGIGGSLLNTVFGGRTNSVGDLIARTAGFRNPASGASLLSMAAPLVLGFLGKKVREGGLNVGSLTSMLAGERDSILAAAPPGLVKLIDSSDTSPGAAVPTGTSYSRDVPEPAGSNRWLWPVVGLAALALIWFVVSRGRDTGVGAATDSAVAAGTTALDSAAARTGAAVNTATGAISDAAKDLGAFARRTLPGGAELNIPERGIEANLISFIEDGSRGVNDTTWFNFDRLNFATGSATILPESQEQLDNIAAVLKAYPNVNVKIGGYTDSTGDAAANQRLSQQRAEAVQQALVSKGIAAGRLEAEGYGAQHAVADNSTEEGRARNRRIALRVTKK
jgi:OmpA-OmpF porin, OOP family